jgi:hypothetical protein
MLAVGLSHSRRYRKSMSTATMMQNTLPATGPPA